MLEGTILYKVHGRHSEEVPFLLAAERWEGAGHSISEWVRRSKVNEREKARRPWGSKELSDTDLWLWQFLLRQFCQKVLLILWWAGPRNSLQTEGYLGLFLPFLSLVLLMGPKKCVGTGNFPPNMPLRFRPSRWYMSISFIHLLEIARGQQN